MPPRLIYSYLAQHLHRCHVGFVFLNEEDLGARSCGRVDLGRLTRQHQRDLWTEWRSSIWEVRVKLLYLKKRLKISVLARAAV